MVVGGPTTVLDLGGLRVVSDPTFDDPTTTAGPTSAKAATTSSAPSTTPGWPGSFGSATTGPGFRSDSANGRPGPANKAWMPRSCRSYCMGVASTPNALVRMVSE